MPVATEHPVVLIERLDLRFAPRPWAFAEERRAAIDAHFAALRRDRPALWNGRVLLLHEHEIAGTTLRGKDLETDFASFIAWRDWGFPDKAMRNCFAHAALLSADGAFLLGEMGPHTANAGRVYFPGGTPDPSDVSAGRVDMDRNVRRELAEETGLAAGDLDVGPHWMAVLAEPRIALIKLMHSDAPGAVLRDRMLRHMAAEPESELCAIHLVREAGDLDASMPDFVRTFLLHYWGENGEPEP
jgi:8-oxo-dGTP pyrophosphatase MutT (NUDIX family)